MGSYQGWLVSLMASLAPCMSSLNRKVIAWLACSSPSWRTGRYVLHAWEEYSAAETIHLGSSKVSPEEPVLVSTVHLLEEKGTSGNWTQMSRVCFYSLGPCRLSWVSWFLNYTLVDKSNWSLGTLCLSSSHVWSNCSPCTKWSVYMDTGTNVKDRSNSASGLPTCTLLTILN